MSSVPDKAMQRKSEVYIDRYQEWHGDAKGRIGADAVSIMVALVGTLQPSGVGWELGGHNENNFGNYVLRGGKVGRLQSGLRLAFVFIQPRIQAAVIVTGGDDMTILFGFVWFSSLFRECCFGQRK